MFLSTRLQRYTIILLVGLFVLTGCRKHGQVIAGEQAESGRMTIRIIHERVVELEGQTVHLEVRFKGWKGNCKTGPPVSRSDWMVEDETGCIYVTGPLPQSDLDPAKPDDRQLLLTAIVCQGFGNLAYLKLKP